METINDSVGNSAETASATTTNYNNNNNNYATATFADPLTCPVEGCYGIGHINGRSKTHFNPRYCPKLSMSDRMKYGKNGELIGSNGAARPAVIKPSLVRKRRRLLSVRSDDDSAGQREADEDEDDSYHHAHHHRHTANRKRLKLVG
jgi:hypothetical protein